MLKSPRTRSVSLVNAPLCVSKDPFSQFQICNSGDVWTSVDRATANRITRKSTGAISDMIRSKWKDDARRAQREDRRAAHSLLMELREGDRANRALWRGFRVKPVKQPSPQQQRSAQILHRPRRKEWLAGSNPLPSFSSAITDRMGRTGVFLRCKYYGAASKSGVGRRATIYIHAGVAQTEDGLDLFLCNVAQDPEEAMAAMELIEQLNRTAQENGKALFHIIANVPHELTLEQKFEIGKRFAEHQFGSRDLPYAVALHAPSEEGDQRNWHLHILFSTRPMVRTGHHQWDVGEMLRREVEGTEGFTRMRECYADVQTEVAHEAKLGYVYTALSNAARGLAIQPQEHLGGNRTDMVRRGIEVPANERNWERSLNGEAALLDERLRHVAEKVQQQASLMRRAQDRFAKAPVIGASAVAMSSAVPYSPIGALAAVSQPSVLVPSLRTINAALELGPVPIPNLKPAERLPLAVPNLSAIALMPMQDDTVALASAVQPVVESANERQPFAIMVPVLRGTPVLQTLPHIEISPQQPLTSAFPCAALRVPLPSNRVGALNKLRQIDKPVRLSRCASTPKAQAPLAVIYPARGPDSRVLSSAVVWQSRSVRFTGARQKSAVVAPTPSISAACQVPALTALSCNIASRPMVLPALAARALSPIVSTATAVPTLMMQKSTVPAEYRTSQFLASAPPRPSWQAANHAVELALFDRLLQQGEEHRRKRTKQQALNAASTANVPSVDERAGSALMFKPRAPSAGLDDAPMKALRMRDDWVARAVDGTLIVSAETLKAVGLNAEQMVTPRVQRALEALEDHQSDRLDPVIISILGPPPFTSEAGRLVLDARFSNVLRADVRRWSGDPHFQAFVAKIWPNIDRILPSAGDEPMRSDAGSNAVDLPKIKPIGTIEPDAWMRGAAMRRRAMDAWDKVERCDTLDRDASGRPGMVKLRPGHGGVDQEATRLAGPEAAPSRGRGRSHPGMFPVDPAIGG